jgi:release factor glutamine methyltransferase
VLVLEGLPQCGGDVALSVVADDSHDGLASVFWAASNFIGCIEDRTRRNTSQDALFRGEATSGNQRLVDVHVDDLVVDGGVEDGGHEVGADALNLVGARCATVQDGALFGLNGDDLHARLELLEALAHTGDGSTGTHTSDEDVNGAVSVGPDLLSGGRAVNGGVGAVLKLASKDCAGGVGHNLFGARNSTAHALGTRGKNNLSAVGTNQNATFNRHGLGHGQNDLVAASCTHQGQGDTGVTRGALHDGSSGLEFARLLSGIDDGLTQAVLHGVAGVVELELGVDRGASAFGETVDAHQGSVAGELSDVVVEAGHDVPDFFRGQRRVRRSAGSIMTNILPTQASVTFEDIMTSLLPHEPAASEAVSLEALLHSATQQLASAGVPDPEVDAQLLAGSVLALGRGELEAKVITGLQVAADDANSIRDLVSRRAAREPLQHILGVAWFRSLTLEVGPGVFVPRPETEQLAGMAIDTLRSLVEASPIAVDLGTGSGAIALAMATEVPHARIFAVEKSADALPWTSRNFAKYGGENATLIHGDLAGSELLNAHSELAGTVAVIASNPPYIPQGAIPRDPEVQLHDPHLALYGGEDGLDVVRQVSQVALALGRPGAQLLLEHGELQGQSIRDILAFDGWRATATHRDLTGRDRYTTATRP